MENLLLSFEGKLATIILNRPEKRNALSHEFVAELILAFEMVKSNDSTKMVLIKANGKTFSAGADLAYLQNLQKFDYQDNLADSHHLRLLFEMIYTLPVPVIAQVQGDAIAGGCGLVAVCDMVIASEEARFGFTEVKIGFVPALVSVFLMKKIGASQCRNLLLSGHLLSASDAFQLGIIHDLVDKESLEDYTSEKINQLLKTNSAEAMMQTKRLLVTIENLSLSQGLDVAEIANAKARATEECRKGIAAFLEKKKIVW